MFMALKGLKSPQDIRYGVEDLRFKIKTANIGGFKRFFFKILLRNAGGSRSLKRYETLQREDSR